MAITIDYSKYPEKEFKVVSFNKNYINVPPCYMRSMEWINVRDKKPESGQMCIVWDERCDHVTEEQYHEDTDYPNGYRFGDSDVNIWMPLPEVPDYDERARSKKYPVH